jgi:hypothetical protein
MRLFLSGVLALFTLILARPTLHAQNSAQCDPAGVLASPLAASGVRWASVMNGEPNNQREAPGLQAARIGQIPPGDIFQITGGPECGDGYRWWPVDYAGRLGWTAEGPLDDPATRWLEPLTGQVAETVYPDDPAGCQRPPDDYRRIRFDFADINLRTLAMLDHAQTLYTAAGGTLRFRENIMQGSYNPGQVEASFGTHDGGGAVDLSVRRRADWAVLRDEIPWMLAALRQAGFAAWLRDTGSLYRNSPVHIHAIAVADAELSEAARGQLDGVFGYFRGFNGLPQTSGIPLPDDGGERVVCGWMRELGFEALPD